MPRSEEPQYEATAAERERILGSYATAEGGNLRVFEQKGELFVELDGQQFAARMSSPTTAVYTNKIPRPLKFYFRDEEPAWAVFSGLRMLQRQL